MLPADRDLLISLRILHPTVFSGERNGCHLWCDALVNAELHVAIVAIILGGFKCTPVRGMQGQFSCSTGVMFLWSVFHLAPRLIVALGKAKISHVTDVRCVLQTTHDSSWFASHTL
jgi:hypothetical protein